MLFTNYFLQKLYTPLKIVPRNVSTIFALSSGYNRSAVATVRISGPNSADAMEAMANLKREKVQPRFAYLRNIRDPLKKELLDRGLVIWFPAPNSFTGEDSVEFHIHGGTAVIASVLNALQCLPKFRMAEPGEFTKRAFMAGKLDVTEVEGLADLLRAETEVQRKQAIRQVSGELASLYSGWRTTIIEGMAYLEAFIDFGEDQDIGSSAVDFVSENVSRLEAEMKLYLQDQRRGERLRSGVQVAIVGEPNVGKSSLLNLLCRKQAAIVSPYAGTTRDVLEIALDLGGYPLVLCDTAGLRATEDPVEKEGLLRARERASQADLVILVIDPDSVKEIGGNRDVFIRTKLDKLGVEFKEDVKYHILVNKVDLVATEDIPLERGTGIDFVSCKTQQGMEDFLKSLTFHLASLCANPSSEAPCITHSRHRIHLTKCLHHFERFHHFVKSDLALAAEELRCAAKNLGKISGKVYTEEVLDVLFHSFCIGK